MRNNDDLTLFVFLGILISAAAIGFQLWRFDARIELCKKHFPEISSLKCIFVLGK